MQLHTNSFLVCSEFRSNTLSVATFGRVNPILKLSERPSTTRKSRTCRPTPNTSFKSELRPQGDPGHPFQCRHTPLQTQENSPELFRARIPKAMTSRCAQLRKLSTVSTFFCSQVTHIVYVSSLTFRKK